MRKEWEGFKDYEQKKRAEYSEQKKAVSVPYNKISAPDRFLSVFAHQVFFP